MCIRDRENGVIERARAGIDEAISREQLIPHVFYQITDPKMFCYGVANPIMAIENLTATTLRNIIGDLELDQTLTSRETINTKMRASRCV